MKLLKEISDKSLGISEVEILGKDYTLRKSARAILLNDQNEVSIQHVGKFYYYKLPGGGVDPGETVEEALKREIIEEVGCDIDIEKDLGVIIEYRSELNLIHISYGYLCRVKGKIGEPQYEQGEIDDQFRPIWKTLNEAIELMNKYRPKEPYQAPFIVEREKTFLEEAKRILDR